VADPDLKAQGGHSVLVDAGIEVDSGLLSARAEAANYRWLTAIRQRRPFVLVKIAMGVDGRISMPSGESKWITSERSRKEGRRLRAALGSILVGAGTVLADDPKLTVRARGERLQPVRIVLDPTISLSGTESLFQEPGETLWVTTSTPNEIPITSVPGEIDLRELLNELYGRGITGILVEGGAYTISKFFEYGLVDELSVFIGAKILGSGKTWIENASIAELSSAFPLNLKSVRKYGSDVNLLYSVVT
jgi:diaminohydroxyphosphoribosylaminopyrimidine deaminase/5-amino-6-(5-phosphoribosylamino)uracil reductase